MQRVTLFFIELFTSLFAVNLTAETVNEIINILLIIAIRLIFYFFEKKFQKVKTKMPLIGKYINPKKS